MDKKEIRAKALECVSIMWGFNLDGIPKKDRTNEKFYQDVDEFERYISTGKHS